MNCLGASDASSHAEYVRGTPETQDEEAALVSVASRSSQKAHRAIERSITITNKAYVFVALL